MAKDFEIEREIIHIQQALSQNKRPIGFLLCAGCPLSIRISSDKGESRPLISDITGLTAKISEELSGSEDKQTTWDKLAHTFAEDGIINPNIEVILTRVRALKSVAGSGVVRSLKMQELEDLDKEICELIAHEVDKELPSKDSPFHDLAYWVRSVSRLLCPTGVVHR